MTFMKQIITLEVTVDIDRLPLPEQWDWNELAKELGGSARVNVLASGIPTIVPPAVPVSPETPSETMVRRLFGQKDTPVDPTDPEHEGRN